MDVRTQVCVIGGGPAGSTAATLLVREGVHVTLLERDAFPREHIGESLLPSILTFLDLMGIRERFEAHGFVKKYGGYLEWGTDNWELRFGDPAEPGSLYGFQVVRSEFDELLLEHARSQGARVHQGIRVTDVQLHGGRPCAVRWAETHGQQTGELSFDYLIDASGRAGVMPTRYLRNRHYNQGFKNVAAYSYWDGAKMPKKGPPGSLLVGSIPDGWIWGIPLHNGMLSVGTVMHTATFRELRNRRGSIESVYREAIAQSPLITDLLVSARCVRPVVVEQDFSYICDRSAGPGFFVAGDAACFLDPLLASGVHLATFSAMLAAAGTSSLIRGELPQNLVADYYTNAYRTAYVRFLVLVSSLYLNYRGKESLFWDAHRISQQDVDPVDIQRAFRHLVSGLEDMRDSEEGGSALVLSEMRRLVDTYFPKEAGRDDAWLATLSEEEQKRVLEEIEPLTVPMQYSVSEESALNGFYVRTKPLGLVRAEGAGR